MTAIFEELIAMLRKRHRRYLSKAAKCERPEDAQYWLEKAHAARERMRELRAAQSRAEEGGDYVPTV